jgi:hypothetical protein
LVYWRKSLVLKLIFSTKSKDLVRFKERLANLIYLSRMTKDLESRIARGAVKS